MKVFRMYAIFLGSIAFATLATLSPAQNLLPDPGFENGGKGWTIPTADGGMSRISEDAAFNGKYGLYVTDASVKAGSSAYTEWFAVNPGETWQTDFYARMISGDGIAVYLQYANAGKTIFRPTEADPQIYRVIPAATRHWTLFHLAATAPAEAAWVRIWVHSFEAAEVIAQFDDFVLRKVSQGSAVLFPTSAGNRHQVNPLPAFPKPEPEKFFADFKVLQPDGSAYRVPVEDWQGARERVQNDPQWQAWLNTQQAEADKWIARNRDRAEWEAGWNHEFISPKDGAWLIWTEEVPGEEIDTIMSRTGDKVEITPKIFRAWVGAFRKNHTLKMGDVAHLYRLTGEEKYAEWVAEQLDFYADNYEGWGKGVAQRKGSHLGYQSLDDAVVIARMLEGARLIHDWAAPERKQKWFEKLFKPQALLLDTTQQNIHNISLWQRVAQAQIGLLYNDEEIYDNAMNGANGVLAQFKHGITSDYFWYEQSMGYNDFILMAASPLLTFAGLVGEGDRVKDEAAMLQNLMIAPLTIRFADNRLPNPSDNGGIPRAPSSWLERSYRTMPTYYGLSKAQGTRSWDTLIDPPEQIAEVTAALASQLPEVESQNMESTRFAVLKKDGWQLFFHYGQLHSSHSQAEALSWSATYNGTFISYDPGTVGYGSPLHWEWYRRAASHNVPLIESEGQARWDPGKLISFDAEAAIVSAAQPFYWPKGWKGNPWRWVKAPQALQNGTAVSAERTMQIADDRLIELTRIDVEGDTALTLGLALHLLGTTQPDAAFKPVSAEDFMKERSESYKNWKDIRAAQFNNRAEVIVDFGKGVVMKVQFETTGSFTLYEGRTPYTAGSQRTSFYLEKTDKASSAEFTTTLIPLK